MIAEKSEIRFQIMEQKDSAFSPIPEGWNIMIVVDGTSVAGWNCGKQKPTFDFATVLRRMRDIIQSSNEIDMREFPRAAGADPCRWPGPRPDRGRASRRWSEREDRRTGCADPRRADG